MVYLHNKITVTFIFQKSSMTQVHVWPEKRWKEATCNRAQCYKHKHQTQQPQRIHSATWEGASAWFPTRVNVGKGASSVHITQHDCEEQDWGLPPGSSLVTPHTRSTPDPTSSSPRSPGGTTPSSKKHGHSPSSKARARKGCTGIPTQSCHQSLLPESLYRHTNLK